MGGCELVCECQCDFIFYDIATMTSPVTRFQTNFPLVRRRGRQLRARHLSPRRQHSAWPHDLPSDSSETSHDRRCSELAPCILQVDQNRNHREGRGSLRMESSSSEQPMDCRVQQGGHDVPELKVGMPLEPPSCPPSSCCSFCLELPSKERGKWKRVRWGWVLVVSDNDYKVEIRRYINVYLHYDDRN